MRRKPDPLRITHITAPGPVGGLESVVRMLAIGHHQRGLQVEVIALLTSSLDASPFLSPIEAAGVPVHRVTLPPRAYLRERREIRRILEERRPQVVHTHAHRADVVHSGIARSLGLATVTTIHGASRVSWRSGIYEWIQFRLCRRFDGVIAVSRPLVAALQKAGVPDERIWLCPNAWNGEAATLPRAEARKRLDLPPDAFVFGWVGRLIPIKGLDVFLRSLSMVKQGPWVASVIGDGPERHRLQTLAGSLEVAGQVRFHGRINDAGRYFSAFDAFVLSSRSEGTPMVLFEAMAAGVPIVATRVGGVPDVVSPTEALLVAPEDPAQLADALQGAMDRPAELSTHARNAAQRLRVDFSPETWLDRHEGFYRRIARGRP